MARTKKTDLVRMDEKPQVVTRIPPYWPGTWVKIALGEETRDLAGKVRRVKSLTCSITRPDQRRAQWLVHFDDGRHIKVEDVERPATEEEAYRAPATQYLR